MSAGQDPTDTPTMAPPPVVTTPGAGAAATPHDDDDAASETVETSTKGEKSRFLPRVRVLLSKDREGVSSDLQGDRPTVSSEPYHTHARHCLLVYATIRTAAF